MDPREWLNACWRANETPRGGLRFALHRPSDIAKPRIPASQVDAVGSTRSGKSFGLSKFKSATRMRPSRAKSIIG